MQRSVWLRWANDRCLPDPDRGDDVRDDRCPGPGMLTEREKHGMAELLQRLDSSDLTSLAQTVTSRLIVPESTAEAVAAIVLHTDRAADLLRR